MFAPAWARISVLLASAAGAADETPLRVPSLEESIRVERVLVEARVLDREGLPVRGLTLGDFELRVDGERVPILSVDWIEGYGAPGESVEAGDPATPRESVAAAPRYTIVLVQRDLDPSRIVQLMRVKPYAVELIEGLGPDDRMAILIHENGLHLLADFTADRDGLRRIMDDAVVCRGTVPEVREAPGASLRERIGESGMRDAVHVETALLRLADALEGLPGSKTVFFFAWGMGVFTGGGVLERPDQGRAVAALRRANATLLTFDLTNADYHSLETPLIQATRDTGGLYVKGHVRPSIALGRLRSAAAGHYVLAFAPPRGDDRERSIRIRVPGTGYEVLSLDSR